MADQLNDRPAQSNAQRRRSVYIRPDAISADTAQATRKSTWRNQSSSSSRRYSLHGNRLPDSSRPRVRTLQPTFRLEPKRPLDLERINQILKCTTDIAVASNALERFSLKQANHFCPSLAHEIQLRLRGEQFDRYRFVAIVNFIEKHNQCVMEKMGFMWDTSLDQWASYVIDNQFFTLNVCVMCVYFE